MTSASNLKGGLDELFSTNESEEARTIKKLNKVKEKIGELFDSNISQFPHKTAKLLIKEYVGICEILRASYTGAEMPLFEDLVRDLTYAEKVCSGTEGIRHFRTLLKNINHYWSKIVHSAFKFATEPRETALKSIESMTEAVFARIVPESEAFAVEDELVEFVHEVEAESVPSFASTLVHPNYITHYVAYHRHFTSQVVVVVWKSCVPGGKVVIFVHHGKKFEEWYSKVEAVPSASELNLSIESSPATVTIYFPNIPI